MNSDRIAGIVKLKLAKKKVSQRGNSTENEDDRGKSSSVESLDRIHTFNLKNAARKI